MQARFLAWTALLTVISSASVAQEATESWLPDQLTLPQDATVTVDRAIGLSTRMKTLTTEADPELLFQQWQASLSEAGYDLRDQSPTVAGTQIQFSGYAIDNAKIVVLPSADGYTVIQIDATLD